MSLDVVNIASQSLSKTGSKEDQTHDHIAPHCTRRFAAAHLVILALAPAAFAQTRWAKDDGMKKRPRSKDAMKKDNDFQLRHEEGLMA